MEVLRRSDKIKDYAYSLSKHGREEEAAPLMKTALDLRLDSFGPDDLKTVMAMNMYAIILNKLSRHAESVPLFGQVLKYRIQDPQLRPRDRLKLRSLKQYADALDKSG